MPTAIAAPPWCGPDTAAGGVPATVGDRAARSLPVPRLVSSPPRVPPPMPSVPHRRRACAGIIPTRAAGRDFGITARSECGHACDKGKRKAQAFRFFVEIDLPKALLCEGMPRAGFQIKLESLGL